MVRDISAVPTAVAKLSFHFELIKLPGLFFAMVLALIVKGLVWSSQELAVNVRSEKTITSV